MKKLVMPLVIVGILVLAASVAFATPGQKDANVGWAVTLQCSNGQTYSDALRSPEIVRYGLKGSTVVLGTRAAASKADRAVYFDETYFEYAKEYWFEGYVNVAPTACPGGATQSAPSAKVFKLMPDLVAPPLPPILTIAGTAFELQPAKPSGFGLTEVGTVALGVRCDGTQKRRDPMFAAIKFSDIVRTKTYLGGKLYGVCG